MHELILVCGFLGAWLLVVGPLYQAVLELNEEDAEVHRLRERFATAPPPEPVSALWLLLPPVWWVLRHNRREAWQEDFMTRLSDTEYDVLVAFVNKARGWAFVGFGGFLIATKETWEMVEGLEWPHWLFWLLLVVMTLLAIGQSVARQRHENRERARRAAASG